MLGRDDSGECVLGRDDRGGFTFGQDNRKHSFNTQKAESAQLSAFIFHSKVPHRRVTHSRVTVSIPEEA